MKELIEYVAKSLVDHPEQVVVRELPSDDSRILQLEVARDDIGKTKEEIRNAIPKSAAAQTVSRLKQIIYVLSRTSIICNAPDVQMLRVKNMASRTITELSFLISLHSIIFFLTCRRLFFFSSF